MKRTDQTTQLPDEPAGTEFERFRDAVKQIISVPKEEIDKREAEYQKERVKLRAAKPRKAKTVHIRPKTPS